MVVALDHFSRLAVGFAVFKNKPTSVEIRPPERRASPEQHKGTLIWINGLTTQDPEYESHKANWEALGNHSFRNPQGLVRTDLAPGQILKLFERYTVLHHREGLGSEHRHGDSPPERHGKFEVVLMR